nr:MAG TPA: hypothetical protein [Caudoviricetes sp.]
MVAFFVCTTGKSIEPADLAELVKGAAQCSYRCGELNGELADRRQ